MTTTTPSSTGTSSRSELEEVHVVSSATPAPAPGRPAGSRSRNTWRWLAALVLLVLVAAAAGIYYVTSAVRVDLSVDGQTQSIDTRADSVADLLIERDITVTDADLVEPPRETELGDGDTIVVSFARSLTVTIDGSETVHSTTELTIGDALEALDVGIDGAAVSLPMTEALSRGGAAVDIVTPKSIALDVGGEALSLTSTAKTVGDVLDDEAIVLSETDTLAPPTDTAVTDAMAITVTRIRVENETRTETIAHDTVDRNDPDLTVGTRKVVTDGIDGSQDVTHAVTYTNDEITSEQVLTTTVTKEPATEVVAVGTKPVAVKPVDPGVAAGGAAADLNWAALAQCESSGNPTAVNPAGYYGLYQFSPATWASVGGAGNPADATPAEQTNRAQILYNRSGAGQWPHCGPRLFG